MSYPGGYPPQGQQPGQPAYGQPTPQGGQYAPAGVPAQYGQPQSQPHMSQPQWGQPTGGQAQPPYGQPPHPSQPQMMQPQYGQPPVGQPHPSQPHMMQPQAPYGQPPQQYGQFAPQAPYGPAPDAPAPPGITVDASYMWFAFLLALIKPKIFVNGQPVPHAQWGPTHIPAGPGQYHVRVVTPWLFDMGAADMAVAVADGPGSRVYYKPPAAFFLKGAIGPVPQKTPGIIFVWLPFAVVGVMFLLIFLLILVGSLA